MVWFCVIFRGPIQAVFVVLRFEKPYRNGMVLCHFSWSNSSCFRGVYGVVMVSFSSAFLIASFGTDLNLA